MLRSATVLSPEAEDVESRRGERSSRALVVLLAALAGLATGAAVIRLATVALGSGQAWGMYTALEMLRGMKLNGSALVEESAPLRTWLSIVPAWFSLHTRFSAIACFHGFLVTVLVVAGGWSAKLYRATRGGGLLCWWVFVLMLSALSAFLAVPDALGEREHLLTYLLLPYLVTAALRIEGVGLAGWHKAMIGLAGAVAVCLVPQYLLVVVGVEALVLARVRHPRVWLDASLLVLVAGCAVYGAAVMVFSPGYLGMVVPLLKETSWGMDRAIGTVFAPAKKTLVLLVAGTVFYVVRRRRMANEAFLAVLLVASAGSLVIFLEKHTGWVFQMMPFRVFSYLALTLYLADTIAGLWPAKADEEEGGEAGLWRLTGTVAGIWVVLSLMFFARRTVMPENNVSTVETLRTLYAGYPTGTAVSFLSPDEWEFPAVLEQDKVWSSRYGHLWMLPALVRSGDPEDAQAKARMTVARSAELAGQVRASVTEDLAKFRPVVVAVDPCGRLDLCPALGREGYGNLLEWFQVDDGFRAEWAHYQYVRTENAVLIFERVS